MRSRQLGQRILLVIILAICLAWSFFRFYYLAKHGEEFFPSMVKRLFQPTEATQEILDVDSLVKLTVNPNYDGANKEYIYDTSADADAVIWIHQTITYQYYDDDGDAIRIVETKSYNASGETLFSSYKRESCKMANTDITRQEIEITYRYDAEKIYRKYTINSYAGTVCTTSASDSSEKDRA